MLTGPDVAGSVRTLGSETATEREGDKMISFLTIKQDESLH